VLKGRIKLDFDEIFQLCRCSEQFLHCLLAPKAKGPGQPHNPNAHACTPVSLIEKLIAWAKLRFGQPPPDGRPAAVSTSIAAKAT